MWPSLAVTGSRNGSPEMGQKKLVGKSPSSLPTFTDDPADDIVPWPRAALGGLLTATPPISR